MATIHLTEDKPAVQVLWISVGDVRSAERARQGARRPRTVLGNHPQRRESATTRSATVNRQEIEAAIQQINDELKGPRISNIERLLLNEDRRDLRNLLAKMDNEPVQGTDGQEVIAEEPAEWSRP
jgi:hypothetical protein